MFSEVLHGLVGRTQRNAGVDQNQPRAALVPSPLRIGIIPAGRGAASPPSLGASSLVFLQVHFVAETVILSPHGCRLG